MDCLSSRSALVVAVAAAVVEELVDVDNPECQKMVH